MKTVYVCVDTTGSCEPIVKVTDNIRNLLEYIHKEYVLPYDEANKCVSIEEYGLSEKEYYDSKNQPTVEQYLFDMWNLTITKTHYEDTLPLPSSHDMDFKFTRSLPRSAASFFYHPVLSILIVIVFQSQI